jgi:hypothetical protein
MSIGFARSAVYLSTLCLLLVALLPLSPDVALAGDKVTKLERQINVMTRAIDAMLVDSPNFLVSSSQVTEGFEDDEYGALFVFQASLTGAGWPGGGGVFGCWPWDRGKERKIVIRKGDKGDDEDIDIDGEGICIDDGEVIILGKGDKKLKKLIKEGRCEVIDDKEYKARQLKKYESAREELLQTLMDYGEILRGLAAGRSVKIIARMHDMDLPEGKEVRKLSVRASIDDLRAYGDGRLSDQEMRSRIEIKES